MFGRNMGSPHVEAGEEEDQSQLQLFGNVKREVTAPAACNVGATNFTGNNNVHAVNRPNKRNREAEDMGRQHKLQISLNNFFKEEVNHSQNNPNPNPVSTGLRLSYDDEHNSSVSSSRGSMPSLPILSSLHDNLRAEIDHQKEEIHRFLKLQEEHIMHGWEEMKQRHMASFRNAVESWMGRKLQEKELEIENVNRKNRELFEQTKKTVVELKSWKQKAQCNESLVNRLNSDIKQAMALGAGLGIEECGESKVDDAASSYNPNHIRGSYLKRKTGRVCKSCKRKEISMLMIPCRHLCLCEDCAGFINVCPVCRCVKSASVHVNLC